MAVIKSPNQEYTGTSAGVTFVNGVGNDNATGTKKYIDHKAIPIARIISRG